MNCGRSVNSCMYQGDDLRIFVEVEDSDGLPVDISGALSIKWQLAQSVNGAALISKSLGSGIVVNTNTEFYFDLASSETQNLSGSFYHEAEIVTDTGKKYTGFSGRFQIKPTLIKP